MRDRTPMFSSSASPAYTTSKKHLRLPELNNSSRSPCNPLPILQVKQNNYDSGRVTTVLPSILKPTVLEGNSNPRSLEKCMTISVLDSKTQHDTVQQVVRERRRRGRRSKICTKESSYDWLQAEPDVEYCSSPTKPPLESSPAAPLALPYNGLVLTGHGINHATRQKDADFNTIPSSEVPSPPTTNLAKLTEKEHHVTFHQLPKHHRRHSSKITNAFSITGLTCIKEKQKLQTSPRKCYSEDNDTQDQANLKIAYPKHRQLPKIGKASHLKAVRHLLGGRRIIYNQPPTVQCSDGVPLPQLAPVVKGLNRKSRKLTTSPSLSQLLETKTAEPAFLPKLSTAERFNMVSQGQGCNHQQLGQAATHKRAESISPPLFNVGPFKPRPPQQILRATSTPRKFHSREIGSDNSIRAKGRHE